jgi:hypothetical protein
MAGRILNVVSFNILYRLVKVKFSIRKHFEIHIFYKNTENVHLISTDKTKTWAQISGGH